MTPTAVVARFDAQIDGLAAVGLADVEELSSQARFDQKFLISVDALQRLIEPLSAHLAVLEVAGERSVTYSSRYFDTPDLRTYHDHRQGRRRRFKVRTRHYGDPGASMLEVKCKGKRGQTVKYRRPHTALSPDVLNDDGVVFVAASLASHYGFGAPGGMVASAQTRFVRTTFVDLEGGERLTVDRSLVVAGSPRSNGTHIAFNEAYAIVESKSVSRHPRARRALSVAGARPGRLSKYCMGVVALHDNIAGNRWRRSLRQLAPRVIDAGPVDGAAGAVAVHAATDSAAHR